MDLQNPYAEEAVILARELLPTKIICEGHKGYHWANTKIGNTSKILKCNLTIFNLLVQQFNFEA